MGVGPEVVLGEEHWHTVHERCISSHNSIEATPSASVRLVSSSEGNRKLGQLSGDKEERVGSGFIGP